MEKIKQVLAQEDTVLFIGSGISLWSGLPTWPEMIEELAQFLERNGSNSDLIRTEAKKGELLQAASYGFYQLTPQQIGEFIRAACRYGKATPQSIHQKIVSLGPRCFVTTNYDDLIEQSIRKWHPNRFYPPPVTNRHLTEIADIVHTRATDFIFKPHGDASDCASIILTREQYRQLLPQGDKHAALETLKTLLVSRPVIYLGFGLRDPDFIYVRNLLANTYKGGTRQHYAIMADVHAQEIDYWRREYGIHLISYSTTERTDKSKDHLELLTLLDVLAQKKIETIATSLPFDPKTPDVCLALARHAAALGRIPKLPHEFSIRVLPGMNRGNIFGYVTERYAGIPVDELLDSGPDRTVLLGLPGAGKTYALKQAAARLANQLQESCIAESFDPTSVIVPILIDLKLYRGNLNELINQSLPISLPFHELTKFFKVKVFLDSFNEMPREFREAGLYESDFNDFIRGLGRTSVVIGSRTTDGLTKFELQVFSLERIEEETISFELQRLGINLEGRFSSEIRRLLQRPFYFQYIVSNAITLPAEANPKAFYKCLFNNVQQAFVSRFNKRLDLEHVLSLVAYESLNNGEEVFPLTNLLKVLNPILNADASDTITVADRDVANWLVSSSLLIPYTGNRVAFVHQSVTEYLAATELARQYLLDPTILKKKLKLTRWDQTLFSTLSLLPSIEAEAFIKDVIKADFVLALTASKYLEVGRDEVISKLLTELPQYYTSSDFIFDHKLMWAFEFDLALTEAHELQLRELIKHYGTIGGAALKHLVLIKGVSVKQEFLQLLFTKRNDYNFCNNGIACALLPFTCEADVHQISVWADEIQAHVALNSWEDKINGFIYGAATLLKNLELSVVFSGLLPETKLEGVPWVRTKILCNILQQHHSTYALEIAGELLLRGVKDAAVALYFISKNDKAQSSLSWVSFTSSHVHCLLAMINEEEGAWGLDALVCLCAGRPDFRDIVKAVALSKFGIEKAALLYSASPSELAPVFDAISELRDMNESDYPQISFEILKHIKLDWSGKEQLFVQLLKSRNIYLARSILYCVPAFTSHLKIDIGAVDWWLDWIIEKKYTLYDNTWSFFQNLGEILVNYSSSEVRDDFVTEFNKENTKYRKALLNFIFPYLRDVTIDQFNENSISYFLDDLNRKHIPIIWNGHPLSYLATERFVNERLLPLLPDADGMFAKNLEMVIKQVGLRHGRRYDTE